MFLSTRLRQLTPVAIVLASAVIVVAFYLPALHYPFISDDEGYIIQNTKLAGLRLVELWRLFIEPYNDAREFLPLRDLSYWFDMSLFGPTPSAFRIHNIILYLLCLPLVFAVTSNMWRYFRPTDAKDTPWVAATVTALFALHPSHTEAVVWIAGRKDELSGMFSLIALLLAVRIKRENGFSALVAVACLAALVAAMLAKATAVAVALVIAMLWVIYWLDIPANARRRVLLLWPLACLILAASIALIFATFITTRIPLYFGIESVVRSLAVLGWLARLAVSPESRHFYYPVFEDPYLPLMVALGVVVLALAAFGLVMVFRRRSLEGMTLVVFFMLSIPSLHLLPYIPPTLVSDRYVFLTVWVTTLFLVSLAWRLKPLPRAAILLVVMFGWGFQAAERTTDFRSFEALVETDFHAFPGYSIPTMYVTDIQLSKRLFAEAAETANGITIPEVRNTMVKLVKAHQAVYESSSSEDLYKAAEIVQDFGIDLRQAPVQAQWNSSLNIVWRINRKYLAFEWRNLVNNLPHDILLRYRAGLSLSAINDAEAAGIAAAHLRAAIDSQQLPGPMRGEAYENLGRALLNSGQMAEAEEPLRFALDQSPPGLRAYCLLSEVYTKTGRIEEAARADTDCHSKVPNDRMQNETKIQ